MAHDLQVTRLRRRLRRGGPVSDINVAPFVDVLLVLVVIFMVAAPLLTVGVPVDLPRAEARTVEHEDEPLVVSINKDGQIFLQEAEVATDTLVARLVAVSNANRDLRIFVRGDRELSYGRIMEVMGMISAAGYARVALIAELPVPGRKR
jgi:biopolymer transport protein TolR